jgi:hypothetical protein
MTHAKRRLIGWTVVSLIFFQAPVSFGWGNEGHTYVNRVAAQKIPGSMPKFLRRAVTEIAYLGPEPDRWRNPAEYALKNSQEPDHFIDLERVAWLDPLPRGRYEFLRKLYEKRAATTEHPDDYLPERVGLQPYIVMEVYGRLKAGFREYRKLKAEHESTAAVERAIIFYAGWLGHYVADGSQPLHTTVQYNGWTGPNPKGYTTQHDIHAQFETAYVAANITEADFAELVHAPEALDDPFVRYIAYLKESNALMENVYVLEKAGGFREKGSPEAFEFTTHRLAAGSQMLLNLWYTAWMESAITLPAPARPGSAPAPSKRSAG